MPPPDLLHRSRTGAAARADNSLADTTKGRAEVLPAVGRLSLASRHEQKVRELVMANSGEIVGEEHFPMDHTDYGQTVDKIMSSGAEVMFNTTVAPRVAPFLEQLHRAVPPSAVEN
jgi:hypothetical protein